MERLQVILINKMGPTSQMISSNLSKLPNVLIIHKHSAQEALLTLKLMDKVDLIICQSSLVSTEQVDILNKFYTLKNTQFLTLGIANKLESSLVIEDASDWPCIIKESIRLLSSREEGNEEFLGFEMSFFKLFSKAPCDIYICVKKAKQYDQYIKRIHKDDTIDEDVLKRYNELNVKALHIRCLDSEIFLDAVTKLLEESLKESSSSSTKEAMKVSINFTTDLVKKMGLKRVTPALVNGVVQNLSNQLSKIEGKGVSSLSKLLSNKNEKYFNQIFLTGMIGSNILNEIGWGTVEHKDKITQAAFFCDIYLEFADWSIIEKLEDFDKFELNEKQRNNILNHAKLSHSDIRDFPGLLPDVDKMILHHHGSFSGKELSLEFPDGLSKLSLVFNLAYKFAIEILNMSSTNSEVDYTQILAKFESKYKECKNLEKTLLALNSSFIKTLQTV